jgi:hypothetical protein
MINIESNPFDLDNDTMKSSIISRKYIMDMGREWRNPTNTYIIDFLWIYES